MNTHQDKIPEFAILGHPNEGKSSVVSTLAEDDNVRIGPIPGETAVCQNFPITVDAKEIVRFIDTPGFQIPRATLSWMRKYRGPDELILAAFIEAHKDNPDFTDECELLAPVARGAGIIYVVDGSRPVRNDDRAEMEILRLTGRPRMSIINCKTDDTAFLEQWKNEFRKHFNCLRVFNAQKATYQERLDLFETLKSVDQDWAPALSRVIDAFNEDWDQRTRVSSQIIVNMIEAIVGLELVETITQGEKESAIKDRIDKKYRKKIEEIEKDTFFKLKRLFKHNIFNCELPENSILNEELFNEKTWQLLGLTPREVAFTAGLAGSAAGAVIDVAAAGLTFGAFSAIGGIAGAASVFWRGRRISDIRFKGVRLGRDQIKVGPTANIQLMYVLIDRSLLFYSLIINWAHAIRVVPHEELKDDFSKNLKKGVTAYWDRDSKVICTRFFNIVTAKKQRNREDTKEAVIRIILDALKKISL
ncbi:MAG: GTPase/DUF3482 domain-containing protein [Thermodesulfobacteriota bacterium]|nr:GTPase/DUF3482 domain-containing protein [Thermodesulfobacteriota bacterium]